MNPLIIVSGDGHIGARPHEYRDYIEPGFRGDIDDLIAEDRDFHRMMREAGKLMGSATAVEMSTDHTADDFPAWDARRRLADMDRDGVAAEVLHGGTQGAIQPFYSVMNKPYPPDLRAAGVRAYHRWVADFIAGSEGRLLAVADHGTMLDLKDTVRELSWCAEHGFVSVSLPQNTRNPELPPVHDSYYEPIWSACEELGLVLSVHAGWGNTQGRFWDFAKQFADLVGGSKAGQMPPSMMEALNAAATEASPLTLDMGPRRALWQLMLGGVFDRHPKLHVALTEVRADWIPATLAALDERFERGDTPLKMKPSEYWQRNCFATPSSIHVCEVAMRHQIGLPQLMFGSDYPHPEGTWPQTHDWIRYAFHGVPEPELRAILGENAIRCYGLDRAKLAAIAARIAPAIQSFASRDVDPALVARFDKRGGVNAPAELVNHQVVLGLVEEDLTAVAHG